jgi:hypothetical protein
MNTIIEPLNVDNWLKICELSVPQEQKQMFPIGNRYGKLLLEHARKDAGRLGFKVVYITTGEIGFYEKYSFREVGLTTFAWGRPTKVYEHGFSWKRNAPKNNTH